MPDLSSLVNVTDKTLSGLGNLQTLFNAIQASYRLVQQGRFRLFLKGCSEALREGGELTGAQVAQLKEYFENDFGREQAYDFVKRAIENNSGIATLALGRLYVRCAGRKPPHATGDELILMRALTDLDDREARVLLATDNFSERRKSSLPPDEVEKRADRLEMTREEFNGPFLETAMTLGVRDHFEMRDVIEIFANRRVFGSTVGYLGSSTGSCFSLIKNPRSQVYLDDLRWADQVLNSNT